MTANLLVKSQVEFIHDFRLCPRVPISWCPIGILIFDSHKLRIVHVDSKSRFALPARFWVLMGYWYIQKSSVTLSALRASPSRHTAVKTSRLAEFLSLYGGKWDEIFLRDISFQNCYFFGKSSLLTQTWMGFAKVFNSCNLPNPPSDKFIPKDPPDNYVLL